MFSGAFSTSYSESSSASNQSANNQDFSSMFGKKDLRSVNYTGPALSLVGLGALYIYFKSKGWV